MNKCKHNTEYSIYEFTRKSIRMLDEMREYDNNLKLNYFDKEYKDLDKDQLVEADNMCKSYNYDCGKWCSIINK